MASPPDSAIPRARAAAQRALALDPDLPEGHTSLGITQMVYDWDWAGAEESFRRAIRLRPNDANAHWWLGHLLILTGKGEQGLVESRKALELDPNSHWFQVSLGWHLRLAGRLNEALAHLGKAVRLHPKDALFLHGYAQALLQAGDSAGALAESEKASAIGDVGVPSGGLAHAYGAAGRTSEARRLIAKLLERRKHQYVPASEVAIAYAGLEDREPTLHWLEVAFEEHGEHIMLIKVDPMWNFLRDDPRFIALLRKTGLDR
jgi:Flp pilus assembly protein TadD